MTTTEDVAREMRRLAAERPDYVYGGNAEAPYGKACWYVHGDEHGNLVEAGCLVGQALHALGFSLEELVLHEDEPAGTMLVNLGVTEVSDDAQGITRAQRAQDDGRAWGKAIEQLGDLGL